MRAVRRGGRKNIGLQVKVSRWTRRRDGPRATGNETKDVVRRRVRGKRG